jgi:hypothetical protein
LTTSTSKEIERKRILVSKFKGDAIKSYRDTRINGYFKKRRNI